MKATKCKCTLKSLLFLYSWDAQPLRRVHPKQSSKRVCMVCSNITSRGLLCLYNNLTFKKTHLSTTKYAYFSASEIDIKIITKTLWVSLCFAYFGWTPPLGRNPRTENSVRFVEYLSPNEKKCICFFLRYFYCYGQ